MPTYVYEELDEKGEGTGSYFEVVQSMKDEPLKEHPESGRPVRRVPQMPAIAGEMSDLKAGKKLSNERLDKLGFTKFQRQSDGSYERVAGKEGPRYIKKQD
ncbi:MAG: hypothetical protein JJU33_11665 [Phycisphaerales bacterium]|nr:hypothetical protein [Phycisphaerales bacterium]